MQQRIHHAIHDRAKVTAMRSIGGTCFAARVLPACSERSTLLGIGQSSLLSKGPIQESTIRSFNLSPANIDRT